MAANSNHVINAVTLTGWVSGLRQYHEKKGTKTVFALCNDRGKFYVECCGLLLPALRNGALVMVQGELFSRIRDGRVSTQIAAGVVHVLDQVGTSAANER